MAERTMRDMSPGELAELVDTGHDPDRNPYDSATVNANNALEELKARTLDDGATVLAIGIIETQIELAFDYAQSHDDLVTWLGYIGQVARCLGQPLQDVDGLIRHWDQRQQVP